MKTLTLMFIGNHLFVVVLCSVVHAVENSVFDEWCHTYFPLKTRSGENYVFGVFHMLVWHFSDDGHK